MVSSTLPTFISAFTGAVNPVVNSIGVRAYMGAPLIDRTGTAIGTICVVNTEESSWGRSGLEMIKSMAAEVMELIHRREQQLLR